MPGRWERPGSQDAGSAQDLTGQDAGSAQDLTGRWERDSNKTVEERVNYIQAHGHDLATAEAKVCLCVFVPLIRSKQPPRGCLHVHGGNKSGHTRRHCPPGCTRACVHACTRAYTRACIGNYIIFHGHAYHPLHMMSTCPLARARSPHYHCTLICTCPYITCTRNTHPKHTVCICRRPRPRTSRCGNAQSR
jgi:hypothetical protein